MLYFAAFVAGVLAGVIGVFVWLSWAEKSNAPPYLADILKDDPTIRPLRGSPDP
jgi:TRAP-type C4-dicarboxylate transport system permease large subunit